ncbi:hypothetical protein ABIC10_006403 [Bradyrhizobium sp. S3.2.12]
MKVFIYVNAAKQAGDVEHLKVFATEDAKDWLDENDPEGLARVRCDRPAGASGAIFPPRGSRQLRRPYRCGAR